MHYFILFVLLNTVATKNLISALPDKPGYKKESEELDTDQCTKPKILSAQEKEELGFSPGAQKLNVVQTGPQTYYISWPSPTLEKPKPSSNNSEN